MINAEAAKKIYKTMQYRIPTEPRDLSREWHSDCKNICFPIIPSLFPLEPNFGRRIQEPRSPSKKRTETFHILTDNPNASNLRSRAFRLQLPENGRDTTPRRRHPLVLRLRNVSIPIPLSPLTYPPLIHLFPDPSYQNLAPLTKSTPQLRPHIPPPPSLPLHPNSNMLPTRLRHRLGRRRLPHLLSPRLPLKLRHRLRTHPPRHPHKPRYRVAQRVCGRRHACFEDQWGVCGGGSVDQRVCAGAGDAES